MIVGVNYLVHDEIIHLHDVCGSTAESLHMISQRTLEMPINGPTSAVDTTRT